ncbi:MAG: hypothetical protein Kow00120_21020 [Anaerolineae bacterium]
MRIRLTSRQMYTIFAILMVVVMAIGGSGLIFAPGSPDPGEAPRQPTFAPPEGTPDVPLGAVYRHPSGYFEITPPLGWALDEVNEAGVASAGWVSGGLRAVVHAFVLLYDAPVTGDEFLDRVQTEFSQGFSNYDAYTVVARDPDSDPMTIDFDVELDGEAYIAREWASPRENLIWVLRVVVPASYPALLAYLEEAVLPTYRVFPDAVPVPSDWEAYTDETRWYTFKRPAGWANLGTGGDGARRFADALTNWQAEMAVLVQPGTTVRTEDGARAWLEALEPEAEASSVAPAERRLGEGYLVSFSYPGSDGESRRGLLLLINANDAVYRVDLRLPRGADDPLNEAAQQRAQEAIEVLNTFTPLPAEGPIPTPLVGGAGPGGPPPGPTETETAEG